MVRRIVIAIVFLCVIAIIASASYLRTQHANQVNTLQRRELGSVSRVVLYRVEHEAGPRFRLSGAETGIRIVSHVALDRSVAWPVEKYQSKHRYPYGLELIFRDASGKERWRKKVYISSAVSKGSAHNGVWTKEASFSESRTFVPTDARITQVELPEASQVDDSLEIRLIGTNQRFAMVRAYALSRKANHRRWLERYSMSPSEKQSLVQGITYLSWDEISRGQQDQRMSFEVTRLTAASKVQQGPKIVPLFVSSYRVPRTIETQTSTPELIAPWSANYVVQGPAHLELKVSLPETKSIALEPHNHILRISQIDGLGQKREDAIAFDLETLQTKGLLSLPLEVAAGLHTIKVRWDPPRQPATLRAIVRPRGPGIRVHHAHRLDQGLPVRLETVEPVNLDRSGDRVQTPNPEIPMAQAFASPMYYLDGQTPALRFPIPKGNLMARLFQLQVRDWDHKSAAPQSKILTYTFLDDNGHIIHRATSKEQSELDRDSWVRLHGDVIGDPQSQDLGIPLGQRTTLTGLAPKGSAWLQISARQPLLVKVSAKIPLALESYHRINSQAQWSDMSQRPRTWIPLLATDHETWSRNGWRVMVRTPHLPKIPRQFNENADQGPKWWRPLNAQERPFRHRVLEEMLYQDKTQGLVSSDRSYTSHAALWEDCHQCWIEIPPFSSYRVVDTLDRRTDPQVLWIADTKRQRRSIQNLPCEIQIDEHRQARTCPAGKERRTETALSGGSHAFSWSSYEPQHRLWIDRWSIPSNGQFLDATVPIYMERRLEKLGTRGINYNFIKQGDKAQYLHFRIYRRRHESFAVASNAQHPTRFELRLDQGNPTRIQGGLFSQFTVALKEVIQAPSQASELIFLDADHSGSYERFDVKVFVGQDIAPGHHQVRLRPQQPGDYWVRAFERDPDPETTSTRRSSVSP